MTNVKSSKKRNRAKKEFNRAVHPELNTEERLKIFANLIVDRLLEMQQEGLITKS
jgi:hypothetical protein